MGLLERYLQAVRTHLPVSQQDDILKELKENLRAQIEERESAASRPLKEDELADILKRQGHPLFVAMRYRQTRHLVGSTLFPVYWFVMKVILALVLLGYAAAACVLIARGRSLLEVIGAVFSYAGAVLPTFVVVTIIFAALDISNSRFRLFERATKEWNEKFDPHRLPALRPVSDFPDAKPIPRLKTGFDLFFNVAFLLWWIRVSPIRNLAMIVALVPLGLAANEIPFQMGPVWNKLYWPVILISLVTIVRQIITLIHPDRVKFYSVMRVITNGGSVVVLYFLTRGNELFVPAPGTAEPAKFTESLHFVNMTARYGLIFAAVITVVECLRQLWRLFHLGRKRAAVADTMV
jgi:hypothetical protein